VFVKANVSHKEKWSERTDYVGNAKENNRFVSKIEE
jgi:hypothetical protein